LVIKGEEVAIEDYKLLRIEEKNSVIQETADSATISLYLCSKLKGCNNLD
jgi:hypothetical protein